MKKELYKKILGYSEIRYSEKRTEKKSEEDNTTTEVINAETSEIDNNQSSNEKTRIYQSQEKTRVWKQSPAEKTLTKESDKQSAKTPVTEPDKQSLKTSVTEPDKQNPNISNAEPNKQQHEKGRIYLDIVLDEATSKVNFVKQLCNSICILTGMVSQGLQMEKAEVQVMWGLTLLSADSAEAVDFSGEAFTSSVEEILSHLQKMLLTDDECISRNIETGLKISLHKLTHYLKEDDHGGFLLLTDSLPNMDCVDSKKEPHFMDLRKFGTMDFAVMYLKQNEDFLPLINWKERNNIEYLPYAVTGRLENWLKDKSEAEKISAYILTAVGLKRMGGCI